MSIKGRDKEFRIPKVSYLDFKHIEMDRVLTMLFPRLKYEGYASRRPPRGGDLSVDEFLEDFLEGTSINPFRHQHRRDQFAATPIQPR